MVPVPKTKAELFERMDESRSGFLQGISGLTEAQIAESGPPDGWSVKDHLAHLAAWALGIAALLRRESRWGAMGLDEQFATQGKSMDEVNAALHEQNKNLTVAQARANFESAHQQVRQAVERLADEDLFKPYAFFQPDEPRRAGDNPIVNWITGNTYEHYDEHKVWIEELIALRKWGG